MSSTYTHTDFTPDAIPSSFNKDARNLIRTAVGVGWKLLVTNKGHVTLVPPHPHEGKVRTINLSPKKSDGPISVLMRKVLKYGNPLLLPPLPESQAQAKEVVRNMIERIEDHEDKVNRSVRTEPATAADRATRKIVHVGPMISKRSRGRGYPSPIANQRDWSDGSTDYICAFEGCTDGPGGGPYVSDNRLAMGPHRKVHVNRNEVERVEDRPALSVDIPETEPAYTKGYHPREQRKESLAHALLTKFLTLGPDLTDWERCEALAEAALAWDHEATGGGLHRQEREPLTDAEVLAKIRAMLDNGLYQQQADEIAAQRAAREAAEERATAAEVEAQRVKDDVSGLLDLLAEYRTEEKK